MVAAALRPRTLRAILLGVLLLIVLLFALLIGASFLLLGTEKGFSWTTEKLQGLDPRLTFSTPSGNLTEGIATDRVSWSDKGIDVAATGVSSKWRRGCVLRSSFCLDYLDIKQLDIKLDPAAQPRRGSPRAADEDMPLPELPIPGKLQADRIYIELLRITTAPGRPALELRDINLSGSAEGDALSLQNISASYRNYSASFNGELQLSGNYRIKGELLATARKAVAGRSVSAVFQLGGGLRYLAVNGDLRGAVSAKVVGRVRPLRQSLPVELLINWEDNGWPLDSHTTFKSSEGLMRVTGDMRDYNFQLGNLFSGEQFPDTRAELKGRVNPERLLLTDINLFSLGGFITGSGAVSWDDRVIWLADLIGKKINPGLHWPQMQGDLDALIRADGEVAGKDWSLNVRTAKVDGELRRFPIDLDGQLLRNFDNEWRVPWLTLKNGPNSLQAGGMLAEELEAAAVIKFPAVHYLVPSIAGDLSGNIAVTGELRAPDVKSNLTSELLKVGPMLLRGSRIDTSLGGAGFQDSSLDVAAASLNVNGQLVKAIKATLDGQREQHSFEVAATVPGDIPLHVVANGALDEQFNWGGEIIEADARLPGHNMILAGPMTASWQHQRKRATLGPSCWQLGNASLCSESPLTSDPAGSTRLTLNNYPLDTLNELLPLQAQVSGDMQATARVSWDRGVTGSNSRRPNPANLYNATVETRIDNGAITLRDDRGRAPLRFAYDSLELTAEASPTAVNSDLKLTSRKIGNGTAALALDPRDPDKSIQGAIDLAGLDIGFLKAFLPGFSRVDGTLDVAGDLSGSLKAPAFLGAVTLNDPVFRPKGQPLGVEGGKLVADIAGKSAVLKGNIDTGKGELRIGGKAAWPNPAANDWNADITVDGEGLQISRRPLTLASIDPSLRIGIKPGLVSIRGKVDVPSADINVRDRDQAAATLSDDVVIIEEEAEKAAEQIRKEQGTRLDMQLVVNLGDDVNLSGYDLNARLTGEIRLRQKGNDPMQLGGEITIPEGFYKSYGQDLKVENGQILFIGPLDQTRLNIDAVRTIEAEDRVAGLHLEGPIADPVVTLFTNPADKTQESILSYIVLGRDINADTTTDEQSMLTRAALALTISQGRGFATEFAESLGISDFTLDATGSGDDTQVVVSGRLNSRLLLRYGRSVFTPVDTLYLRYDINKRLYLEAAQGAERAVDLFYSFSF